MAAKISPEMQRARKMLEDSKGAATAYSVAKACNLTAGAITRSAWYKAFIAARPCVENTDARARRLIIEDGYSAYAAAKVTGLSQSTISRRAWYRDHIERTTIK